MAASLLTSPPEIIRNIVLLAGCDNLIGPPTDLLALLRTCRTLYYILCFDNCTVLYAAIFFQKFDTLALYRRRYFSPEAAKFELRRRFQSLQCFRQLLTNDIFVTEAFTTALFMLLEDDGLNSRQLVWARFPQFINTFLRQNIFDGADKNHRWPLENLMNTLAINLLWFRTSRASLATEFGDEHEEIMRSLQPFAFAAFQYPSLLPPVIRFNACSVNELASMHVHGSQIRSFIAKSDMVYFGRLLTFRTSTVAVSALLSYFARLEKTKFMVPSHLPPNRAVANAQGRRGPTQQDIIDFNTHARIHLLEHTAIMFPDRKNSECFDDYWSWMVSPYEPLYRPGALSGHWCGTAVIPDAVSYRTWMSNIDAPDSFGNHSIRPLYFTLREHYCYSPSLAVPLDDEENGILNAWLPQGCKVIEHENGVEFFDERGKYRTFYETYRPDDKDCGARFRGIVDVIITGTVDANRGAAWGEYIFIGRVRLSDGATVLLREPVNPWMDGWGSTLMRGEVTMTANFVGRWHGVSKGDTAADLETMFVMCKSDEP